MTPAEVRAGVRQAWALVSDLGLLEALSGFEPLTVNEEFRDIALDQEKRYEELYLVGLRDRHYNFMLYDYSYFQFSSLQESSVRFAYYPNPFLSTAAGDALSELREALEEEQIDYEEYLHRVSEFRAGMHPPPVRFENSPAQYKALTHPQSHFHLGHHADNRWPAERIVTPKAFTMLMCKHFYPAYWNSKDNLDALTGENKMERMLSDAKSLCALVPAANFTAPERAQFFLA